MGGAKARKWRFFAALGLILALILTGMVMVGRVFNKYEEIILSNEDDQLFGLARSVDRSVDSYLNRYGANLTYVTQRWGFRTAEESWRTTGETAALLENMEDNLLAQDDLIVGMVALWDGTVFLSTDGRRDYRFPDGAGRKDGPNAVKPCLDGDGNVYLAFLREVGGGLSYAALMDLPGFYQRVAGDLTFGTQDRILLQIGRAHV